MLNFQEGKLMLQAVVAQVIAERPLRLHVTFGIEIALQHVLGVGEGVGVLDRLYGIARVLGDLGED